MVAMLSFTGCVTPKLDPLAGWQSDFSNPPQAIISDYEDYMKNLPNGEAKFAGASYWLKDGTGQHAVTIDIPLNGKWWRHIIVYDSSGKRVKIIKYSPGGYRS
jgi:hypothetical protein